MSGCRSLYGSLFACIFLLVQPGTSSAQEMPVRFERYAAAEHVLPASITAMWQDQKGSMWFGSRDGLFRFDGFRTIEFFQDGSNSTSISDNWVTAIAEDQSGYLWIGTRNGGLNRLDPNTFVFTQMAVAPAGGGAPAQVISSLLVDRSGDLWIGTLDAGLLRRSGATGEVEDLSDSSGSPIMLRASIWTLAEDGRGHIWAGTWEHGLLRYERRSHSVRHYGMDPHNGGGLAGDRIRSIIEDGSGVLWIGISGGGLQRYDQTSDAFITYRHEAGNPYSLSNNVVWDVLEDSFGETAENIELSSSLKMSWWFCTLLTTFKYTFKET